MRIKEGKEIKLSVKEEFLHVFFTWFVDIKYLLFVREKCLF
jgi:hypothetical protein